MTTEFAGRVVRLGTRGSLLARAQSEAFARQLEAHHPGCRVQIVTIRTSGDQITERPLYEVGGKGLFTKELEQALLTGQIDFAVHSFKDVPVTMPLVDQAALEIVATPAREDPRDALVSHGTTRLTDLPAGARIGTGSLRRQCQLLAARADLKVQPIRGNIDTRLRKLDAGEFYAMILAVAGLKRAGLFDRGRMVPIDPAEMLPAPGQGALALQCSRDDDATCKLLRSLNDATASACVQAERELVRLLQGDCHSPIAALAELRGDQMVLQALVGGRDGKPPVLRAAATAPGNAPKLAAQRAFELLQRQGACELLQPH